jgi:hypothetical protein
MFRTLAISTSIISLLAATARADDDPANKARWTVVYYMRQIATMKEESGRYDPKFTVAACSADIAAARKAGVTKLADSEYQHIGGTPAGGSYEITLDRADKLCAEFGPYEAVGKRVAVFGDAKQMTFILKNESSAEYAAAGLKQADKCRAAVDEIVAAKVPATFAVKFGANDVVTVGELKAKVCDALTTAASKYAKKLDDAEKARTEKFTKFGIAGDRLELFKRSWGFLFLAGGASSDDIKKYAAATLIFEWTSSDPDGANMVTHTVRRYQFSGNKLAGTTEKTYRKPKGESLGNVFR